MKLCWKGQEIVDPNKVNWKFPFALNRKTEKFPFSNNNKNQHWTSSSLNYIQFYPLSSGSILHAFWSISWLTREKNSKQNWERANIWVTSIDQQRIPQFTSSSHRNQKQKSTQQICHSLAMRNLRLSRRNSPLMWAKITWRFFKYATLSHLAS